MRALTFALAAAARDPVPALARQGRLGARVGVRPAARAQRAKNDALQARNAALDAEVRDLKQGLEAVEERARFELGMVRQDEVFFQMVDWPRGSPAR